MEDRKKNEKFVQDMLERAEKNEQHGKILLSKDADPAEVESIMKELQKKAFKERR
ncbi:hypothetical protein KY330_04205 [Candidatus Woesearchaeota archaeon]|nr:hypothetical protein [Candidatus Woesearchaeota archaeon]